MIIISTNWKQWRKLTCSSLLGMYLYTVINRHICKMQSCLYKHDNSHSSDCSVQQAILPKTKIQYSSQKRWSAEEKKSPFLLWIVLFPQEVLGTYRRQIKYKKLRESTMTEVLCSVPLQSQVQSCTSGKERISKIFRTRGKQLWWLEFSQCISNL